MSGIDQRQRLQRDHRWARERMSEYADGELAGERRARIERHLHECEGCRGLLDGLRRTIDALHRVAPHADGVGAVEIAALVSVRLDSRA